MPVLPRFPGGRGAAGYKYQSGDVGGVTYSMDAGGGLSLKWSDPADILLGDNAISEWKGTIVVCKEGSAPKSADDGTIICDSTVKDQYKETGLPVGVGGPGYYYGVFPYTKDYVVNVDGANTVYVLSEGYDAALENASWSDIAYIAAQGKAAEIWSVGDEKEVTLNGAYNDTIHLQIAGFGHDDLVGGGKAGITFINKEIFTNGARGYAASYASDYVRVNILPNIQDALPKKLRSLIKKVDKPRAASYKQGDYRVVLVEDSLFMLSLHEVGHSYYLGNNTEGSTYAVFSQDADNRIRKTLSGDAAEWWTCDTYQGSDDGYAVTRTGGSRCVVRSYACGVVFGFCI